MKLIDMISEQAGEKHNDSGVIRLLKNVDLLSHSHLFEKGEYIIFLYPKRNPLFKIEMRILPPLKRQLPGKNPIDDDGRIYDLRIEDYDDENKYRPLYVYKNGVNRLKTKRGLMIAKKMTLFIDGKIYNDSKY